MTQLKISIKTNIKEVSLSFKFLKSNLNKLIDEAIKTSADQLIEDSKPFIPKRTGQLRESGQAQQMKLMAYQLVWSAVNPRTNFNYAQTQYEDVYNHLDPSGRFAAKWVEKVFNQSKEKYIEIVNKELTKSLQDILIG